MSFSARKRTPAPPPEMASSSTLVGRLNFSAVLALPCAISNEASCALSRRCSITMWPPLSMMAITTGQLFLAASPSAAAITFLAFSRLIGGP
jgi:hypothetical protein